MGLGSRFRAACVTVGAAALLAPAVACTPTARLDGQAAPSVAGSPTPASGALPGSMSAFRNADGSTTVVAPQGVSVATPAPLAEERFFVVVFNATGLTASAENVGGAFPSYSEADAYRARWESSQASQAAVVRGRTLIVSARSDLEAQAKAGQMLLAITPTSAAPR